MDIPTLAYVYEGFDAGYGAYVGFHIVRKTHTHPIMLSFIALLLELKNSHAKEESKKSDAFLRARVSSLRKCSAGPGNKIQNVVKPPKFVF